MALFHEDLEEHKQVQVSARKVNLVHHIGEIISLDSYLTKWDMPPLPDVRIRSSSNREVQDVQHVAKARAADSQ